MPGLNGRTPIAWCTRPARSIKTGAWFMPHTGKPDELRSIVESDATWGFAYHRSQFW
ncbi:MAG: hypothetical protein CM1200mP20_13230 [Pseudomonadota bacterium]|nr:MAG: hypothetical protein CM1200mP20_13230 [Pseudomonadota bacterium]